MTRRATMHRGLGSRVTAYILLAGRQGLTDTYTIQKHKNVQNCVNYKEYRILALGHIHGNKQIKLGK